MTLPTLKSLEENKVVAKKGSVSLTSDYYEQAIEDFKDMLRTRLEHWKNVKKETDKSKQKLLSSLKKHNDNELYDGFSYLIKTLPYGEEGRIAELSEVLGGK